MVSRSTALCVVCRVEKLAERIAVEKAEHRKTERIRQSEDASPDGQRGETLPRDED